MTYLYDWNNTIFSLRNSFLFHNENDVRFFFSTRFMNFFFSACAEHCKKCKVKGPTKCDIGECDVNYGNNPKIEDCVGECGAVVVFIRLYFIINICSLILYIYARA